MTRKRTPPARRRTAHKAADAGPDAGNLPAEQREEGDKVGPGHPPKEHQFQPGQSGNPDGPPKHRTNLWVYFTKYMAMTAGERAKVDRAKLTAAQETALKIVERAVNGKGCGFERLARYIVDREEGKAAEHLILDNGADLSDTECEELRSLILKNQAGKPDGCDAD